MAAALAGRCGRREGGRRITFAAGVRWCPPLRTNAVPASIESAKARLRRIDAPAINPCSTSAAPCWRWSTRAARGGRCAGRWPWGCWLRRAAGRDGSGPWHATIASAGARPSRSRSAAAGEEMARQWPAVRTGPGGMRQPDQGAQRPMEREMVARPLSATALISRMPARAGACGSRSRSAAQETEPWDDRGRPAMFAKIAVALQLGVPCPPRAVKQGSATMRATPCASHFPPSRVFPHAA